MVQLFFTAQYASVLMDKGKKVKTQTATERALNFIQGKIAETHAQSGDIFVLLSNPEIAFSLQVLGDADNHLVLTPVTVNLNQQKVQIFTMLASANSGNKSTENAYF